MIFTQLLCPTDADLCHEAELLELPRRLALVVVLRCTMLSTSSVCGAAIESPQMLQNEKRLKFSKPQSLQRL